MKYIYIWINEDEFQINDLYAIFFHFNAFLVGKGATVEIFSVRPSVYQ